MPTIDLELAQRGDSLALEIRGSAQPTHPEPPSPTSVDERIVNALRDAGHLLSAGQLRALCAVRKATFYARLEDLTRSGRLMRSPEGYRLAATA